VVGAGEKASYEAAGAKGRVVEGGALCASRNAALELAKAEGKWCLQMSDDIAHVRFYESDEWGDPTDYADAQAARPGGYTKEQFNNKRSRDSRVFGLTVPAAAKLLKSCAVQAGRKLAGAYPTQNAGFAYAQSPVSQRHFIVGDFIVVDPESPCRFDELLGLKEDYDFTAQHMRAHGGVARCNRLFVKAAHYDNAGGAVDARSVPLEKATIAYLREKWPGIFQDQRRANEVIMKVTDAKMGANMDTGTPTQACKAKMAGARAKKKKPKKAEESS
jgi:hypothetical protein